MKITKLLKTIVLATFILAIAFIGGSCSDDDKSTEVGFGTVTGIVTDDVDVPLADVTVTISGIGGHVETTATTGTDGKYTVSDVSKSSHAVTFSKSGYQTLSSTITAAKFNEADVATVNMKMQESVKVTGTITDAKNNNEPLSGVVVSIGSNKYTTAADGKYILDGLGINDYEITFERSGYLKVTRNIKRDDFVGGEAIIDIRLGGVELLRSKTAADLQYADKWYYSEYRGGRNSQNAYPHWDWACDYMCTLDFWGDWEEQNEGTTIRTRNNKASGDQNNPADMDMFDSYVYGSKKITADNKILSLSLRTHNADAAAPAYFGVQVIDLSASEPEAKKIGETRTHGSSDYADYHFDLSEYVGKEVIVAIGIYRKETGDYWKQLAMRRITFDKEEVKGTNWITGEEVINGWKLTKEMVRSTMPHTKKAFTGKNPMKGNRDSYVDAYRKWRDVDHIGATWMFMPISKDPDVFGDQGYIIKTRGNEPANTKVPESYYYAKFSIANGNNRLTLKTRNYGSNYTFFKLTLIQNNGTVTHIAPISNTATEASAAADGCWKFKHTNGDYDNPDKYASFVYDLSAFNGQDAVLVFGVYNGELNGDENKLVLYNIEIN